MAERPESPLEVQSVAVRTFETVAEVTADGSLVARAPAGLAPGHHRATIVVDEAPDTSLEERRAAIMSCAGAWSDMSDEEMEEFLAGIYARRRGEFGEAAVRLGAQLSAQQA